MTAAAFDSDVPAEVDEHEQARVRRAGDAVRLRDRIGTAASLDELEDLIEQVINLQVTGEMVGWPDHSGAIAQIPMHDLVARRRCALQAAAAAEVAGRGPEGVR